MFILVSYCNDPSYIQDIFYNGKFATEIGVCRALNELVDSCFGEDGEGVVIDSIPPFDGQTIDKEGNNDFFVSMFHDNNTSCVHGIMGYNDDFRLTLTFCIIEI